MLCSLEQEGGAAVLLVGKFGSLAFYGFMVLSRLLGTQKKTRSNHDVNDLQVGTLESG